MKTITIASAVAMTLAFGMAPMVANAAPAQLATSGGKTYPVARQLPVGTPRIANPKKSTYFFDDGSSETAVGFGNGTSNVAAIWFDLFTTVKGGESISSVEIAYGTASNSTPAASLNGLPVTVGIWADSKGKGNPADAVLIAKVKGKIKNANTDKFVTYKFKTPVMIGAAGTNFYVGEVTPAVTISEYFFQALDTTASAVHSYVAAQANGGKLDIKKLGKNDTIGTIDSFGLPGNWLIRANGV